jgi:hypothetical protein
MIVFRINDKLRPLNYKKGEEQIRSKIKNGEQL